ncbi:MAG: 6-phosphofructokinase [Halothiobacillaceae bacterium]|nr:6-phosphofructokinase [Halothiobacillaceae bacterium]
MQKNALYAQSGGVTSVINASACGVIQTARAHPDRIGRVFAADNGILGVLNEDLIDLDQESPETIAALKHTPGGAFRSCRFDLGDFESHRHQYERLIEVFEAHDIGYFFYNGGGGSMLTARKVAWLSEKMGHPIVCMGIPKTIDNDLPLTDTSPGFGSAAKYIATSVREVSFDLSSMATTSTKVFVLEVMGRHAGWLAAAAGLAFEGEDPPLLLLLAEVPHDSARFLNALRDKVHRHGWCIVVAAEGLRCVDGQFCGVEQASPIFGHEQLGGLAPKLAHQIREGLGYKTHWAVSDYFQRSARHLASAVDVEQAYAVGRAGVELALAGKNAMMPVIRRLSSRPYFWEIDAVNLTEVADVEMPVPPSFIREDGYGITEVAREYMAPLIEGESYPPFVHGLPDYARIRGVKVPKKLSAWGG